MIAGFIHQASGLGNQLFRYVATRVLAEDKGYEWGMIYLPDDASKPAGFKGKSFMGVDFGKPIDELREGAKSFEEKKVVENGVDIRGYDPEFDLIEDNTVIEGEFQDPRYFEHMIDKVDEWLQVKPLEVADNVCVIGFRGGEYKVFPDLFLPKGYWDMAIKEMLENVRPDMTFEVHTDDPITAKQFFPDYPIIHDIGLNWRSMRYAQHAIIANSSFYILPRLLAHNQNKHVNTIAPRYWARYNTGVWALPQNFYKQFTYIHHAAIS